MNIVLTCLCLTLFTQESLRLHAAYILGSFSSNKAYVQQQIFENAPTCVTFSLKSHPETTLIRSEEGEYLSGIADDKVQYLARVRPTSGGFFPEHSRSPIFLGRFEVVGDAIWLRGDFDPLNLREDIQFPIDEGRITGISCDLSPKRQILYAMLETHPHSYLVQAITEEGIVNLYKFVSKDRVFGLAVDEPRHVFFAIIDSGEENHKLRLVSFDYLSGKKSTILNITPGGFLDGDTYDYRFAIALVLNGEILIVANVNETIWLRTKGVR